MLFFDGIGDFEGRPPVPYGTFVEVPRFSVAIYSLPRGPPLVNVNTLIDFSYLRAS